MLYTEVRAIPRVESTRGYEAVFSGMLCRVLKSRLEPEGRVSEHRRARCRQKEAAQAGYISGAEPLLGEKAVRSGSGGRNVSGTLRSASCRELERSERLIQTGKRHTEEHPTHSHRLLPLRPRGLRVPA